MSFEPLRIFLGQLLERDGSSCAVLLPKAHFVALVLHQFRFNLKSSVGTRPGAKNWGRFCRRLILGRLLGTARVTVYPTEPRFQAAYRILLDVSEFEGVRGETVRLRVRWTVASVADGRALAVEESLVEQPVASPSFEDLVAAESAALASVSHQIAERVAGLPVP